MFNQPYLYSWNKFQVTYNPLYVAKVRFANILLRIFIKYQEKDIGL